jgi:chemotaxis protein methyltransferase CheR
MWQAKQELRAMIEHRRLNLTQAWPHLGSFDIIMLRNVLIYFDQETRAGILGRIKRTLKPDGYLFIGSAETLIGLGVPFKRQEINGTISYRPSIG